MERDPVSIVVIGASGDLARRKLFPALFSLYCQGYLPDAFNTFGFARSDYTDDAFFLAAPTTDGINKYAVRARCSSEPTCGNDAFLDVTVLCPSSGNLGFAQSIGFNSKTQIGWGAAATVDAVRGSLDTLRSSGTYTGAIQACVANDVNTNTIDDATAAAPGTGLFWLVKGSAGGGDACNAVSSYGDATPGTGVDRDSEIGADANACP